MADIADLGNDRAQEILDDAIAAARAEIPAGKPGDCEVCGEWSGRLVLGVCVPCREKYKLP